MPLNQIKTYNALLDIDFMNEGQRIDSLRRIFRRDIENNGNFSFRNKKIYPLKTDLPAMATLFSHLINKTEEVVENGQMIKRRNVYDPNRAKRLHWIKHHVEEQYNGEMRIFSVEERINGKMGVRTYIHDVSEKYIIVLESQRTNLDYYFITAYYLDKDWAEKAMQKRFKRRLPDLH